MTYNVFGGTLNLALSIYQDAPILPITAAPSECSVVFERLENPHLHYTYMSFLNTVYKQEYQIPNN